MNIGIVSYSLFPENEFNPGIENFGWNLSRELSKSHEVHVFESGSHHPTAEDSEIKTHRSIPLTTFGGFSLNQFLFAWQLYRDHGDLLGQLDVVHDVGSFLPIFSDYIEAPVLTTFQHHSSPETLREFVQGFPVPIIISKEHFADKVVAASEFSANQAREIYGCSDVEVIPNGVDTDIYAPMNEGRNSSDTELTLLFVGPLTARKNLRPLLKSVQLLQRRTDQDVQLRLAGDGPKDAELRKYCSELGISNLVTFLGHVQDDTKLADEYRKADVFVFPSLLEGFGMAVVEALACGTPVAVSNIEPLISIVDGGGEFFDQTDPEDITNTITEMLADENRYRAYCSMAAERGQRYQWSRIAAEYEEIYNKLRDAK